MVKKYSLFFLFCALLYSKNAYSETDSSVQYGTFGTGVMLCEEWIENSDKQTDIITKAWVAGAFTGYENACRLMKGNCAYGKITSMKQLYLRAKAYCRMHPDKRVGDSALNAWIQIVRDPNSF
ncbi:hypothetical protein AA106555_0001 [Neokomagataea thailandica NBRC 106555]|uniref:Uncharacterized protein n=2 Tax=Neokomagataea TaxID=1223423 RepID=A0A4Y6V6N2_9PROT|nr:MULTISPECIES: hypothetical protein [Neokomagataea]QDH25643.1 hypothetical protein D5366_10915 [Neokomagataea tanensis]GBR49848.1 hypothetical protein AA106555_0001 [Neokomagataea thailandica NBRC 106555]